MNERFEEELREALRRVEPPEGFSSRVLARVAREKSRACWRDRLRGSLFAPRWRWAAAAACGVALIGGVHYQREMDRRAQAERAKEQMLLALQVTAEQLHVAQRSVQRALGDLGHGK